MYTDRRTAIEKWEAGQVYVYLQQSDVSIMFLALQYPDENSCSFLHVPAKKLKSEPCDWDDLFLWNQDMACKNVL